MKSLSASKKLLGTFIIILCGSVIFFVIQYRLSSKKTVLESEISSQGEKIIEKRRSVTRIQVKSTDNSCIEMTPDGIVRIFKSCDSAQIEDAQRLRDPKYLLQLFTVFSGIDTRNYKEPPKSGAFYTVTFTSENGSETVYIPVGTGGGGGIGDIITDIIVDTKPTPSPLQSPTSEPTIPVNTPEQSVTPTESALPTWGPSPTLSPTGSVDKGFSCAFSSGTGPRPYNISNFVCSTGPTPNP